jgi:hypothetical protein
MTEKLVWHNREGVRQCERVRQPGTTRSPPHVRPSLPRIGGELEQVPVPVRARLSANHGTLTWLQAANSVRGE